MARTFTIKGRIETEDASSAVVGNVEKAYGGLEKNLSSLIPTYVSVAGAAAVLGKIFKDSVDAASEQEQAIAKLDSALKLLGPSGVAVGDALKRQAEALQQTTTFSDDAVESAQALLATYGVTADVLGVATQATADLSARLGVDLQTAAGQVGAAFNGVTRGLEKVVPGLKSVSDAGFDGAQNIKLLADTMAGGAAEAANTYAGSLTRLGNAANEAEEAFGRLWTMSQVGTNTISNLTTFFNTLALSIDALNPNLDQQAVSLERVAVAAASAARTVTQLSEIQDRATRIISEQATAQFRASQIAKELGLTLEADVIQKREREAELLKELAGLEQEGADIRVASADATKDLSGAVGVLDDNYTDLAGSVDLTNDALRLTPDLFRNIRAEANAATNAVLFTAKAFDELRRAGQGSQAIENATQGGGKLINFGTMIQFPDGSVRLVDAAQRASSNTGGQFTNADGTPRKF